MCTIVLAWRALADAPVAVAANRDEALDRESRPPRVLDDDPEVVAPQDARAGGTWIGASERGLLLAITNRWTEPPDDAPDGADGSDSGSDDRRSRGLLVREALRAADADAALDLVRDAVATDAYAGFNLLLADAERATYLEWDGTGAGFEADPSSAETDATDALRERDLDPGVHAIVNPGLNDADDRAARLRQELSIEGTAPGAGAWLDGAAARLGDHEYGVCVHGVRPSGARPGSSDERSESDGDGFGTRSSSLIAVFDAGAPVGPADDVSGFSDAAGSTDDSPASADADDRTGVVPVPAAYAYADGPPCETRYEQVDVGGSFLEGSF